MAERFERTRRALLRTLLVLVTLVAVAVLGVAWYFAGQLTAVPTYRPFDPDNEVLAADPAASTLTLRDEGYAALDGVWGLQLPDDRHVVLSGGRDAADGVQFGWSDLVGQPPPRQGEGVRVDEFVWVGDPAAVGIEFEDATVDGPLGPLPSWWVPAVGEPNGTIVFVHGRGATREEALRFLPTMVDAGWNVLVQTYRGDEEAPPWPDGRVRYGATEWEDVAAAVDHVRAEEGGPVALFGVSMGGSLVAQYLDRGDTDSVVGVVLDSPLLSMDALLDLQAGLNGIPEAAEPLLLPVVQWFAGIRASGLDADALEQTADDGTFDLPVLLFHGDDDGFVPVEPSARLAEQVDTVEWVRVPEAGHVRSWNVDRATYEQALTTFLTGLSP